MEDVEKLTYLAHLNLVRKEGFRPCMIAVLILNNRVGICEAKDYHWYEFPQGGIEPGELPIQTIEREIKEELGEQFSNQCHFPPKTIKHLFDVQNKMKVKGNLVLDNGEYVNPKGKQYMVFAVELNNDLPQPPQINQEDIDVEFKQCLWVKASEAKELIKRTSHVVKREVAFRAVNMIDKLNLIER